jgi:hypothetical protein
MSEAEIHQNQVAIVATCTSGQTLRICNNFGSWFVECWYPNRIFELVEYNPAEYGATYCHKEVRNGNCNQCYTARDDQGNLYHFLLCHVGKQVM